MELCSSVLQGIGHSLQEASIHLLPHLSFWEQCSQYSECAYVMSLLWLQLVLGGINVVMFVGTAVTVLIVMGVILRSLKKALLITNEFAPTHPRTRRAAQQLKRARTVVRRQLAGVALNGLASAMVAGRLFENLLGGSDVHVALKLGKMPWGDGCALLPLAVKSIVDGRGYLGKADFTTSATLQVRMGLQGHAPANLPPWSPCVLVKLPADQLGRVFDKSSAWTEKVGELAARGVTVRELIHFYSAVAVRSRSGGRPRQI
eukprot:Skav227140  [mRNA]  locus=scaffold133:519208:528418:- [translate_table: standard]